MNLRQAFQVPQQSFPTDVTYPAPTQLPSETPSTPLAPPAKGPQSDHTSEQKDEDERAAKSVRSVC
jgi:hypothetical protein